MESQERVFFYKKSFTSSVHQSQSFFFCTLLINSLTRSSLSLARDMALPLSSSFGLIIIFLSSFSHICNGFSSSPSSLRSLRNRRLLENHDYKDALAKSILFFEGQRSGKLPPNQRMTWRSNSGLSDGSALDVNGSISSVSLLMLFLFYDWLRISTIFFKIYVLKCNINIKIFNLYRIIQS